MSTKQLTKTTTKTKLALACMLLGVSMLAAAASVSRLAPREHSRQTNSGSATANREVTPDEDENAIYALEKLTPQLRAQILEGGTKKTYNLLVILREQADTRSVQGNYREVMRRKQVVAAKTARDRSADSIKNLVSRAERDGDIGAVQWYTLVNGFSGQASFQAITSLNENPNVSLIDAYPNVEHAEEAPDDAPKDQPNTLFGQAFYGPEMIKAPQAWAKGYTGKGIRVGIIDTGVDAGHPALAGKMDTIQSGPKTGELAFFNGYAITQPSDNIDSHGTHVTGIVLGGQAKEGQSNVEQDKYIGVAPSSTYVFGRSSFAPYSLEWIANPDNNIATDDYPIVVNNSWIFSLTSGLTYWIDALEDLGISVVFSAGNSGGAGQGSIKSLHVYPLLLLVGNSNEAGEINPGSSKGPAIYLGESYVKPDVSAPGTNILSAVPKGGYASYEPNAGLADGMYKKLSGTSMSAPMVTGVIALVQQAHFEKNATYLSPGKIKSILQFTSANVGLDNGKDTAAGAGIVDTISAIELALKHATVRGTVKNSAGNTIPFARITIVINNLSYELYTDRYGQFELAIPPGKYSAKFAKKGHTDKTVEFSTEGESVFDMGTIILNNPAAFISYAPSEINFFSAVGSEQVYEIEVYNHGNGALVVSGLTGDNPNFVSKTDFPFSVPAYGAKNILLSFAPKQATVESDKINFLSNAENAVAGITVVGTGNSSNFVDVAAEAGIEQNHAITNPSKIGYSRGVIWAHLNSDEWFDELVGESDVVPEQYFIAFNTNGIFTIPADYNGLKDAIFNENFHVRRLHAVDMDNDGYQDIIADIADKTIQSSLKQQLVLLKNNGSGYFSKQIIDQDFNPYEDFSIADVDNNGLLDIVYTGFSADSSTNFAVKVLSQKESLIFEKGVLIKEIQAPMDDLFFLDYNNNGLLDMLGVKFSSSEGKNGIYVFEHKSNSSFSLAQTLKVSSAVDVAFKDYDNDGDTDMYLQDRMPTPEKEFATDSILVNNTVKPKGGGPFSPAASPYIPKTQTHSGAGPVTWTDYDNDGNPDIFFTYSKQGYNRLFRNLGNHQDYEERAALEGVQGTFNQYDSWDANAVWVDYDRDGDLDLHVPTAKWYHKLYKNSLYEKGSQNHWLQVGLRGTQSNRDAIGARIELIFTDGQLASDQILLTRQSGGQDPRIAHFGLGTKTASDIKELNVYWPGGAKKTYRINKIDRAITITEDQSSDEDANFCIKYSVLKKDTNIVCPGQHMEYAENDQKISLIVDHFDSKTLFVEKIETGFSGFPTGAEWGLGAPVKYISPDGTTYHFLYKGTNGATAIFDFSTTVPNDTECTDILKIKIGLNKICEGQNFLYESGDIIFLIDMYKFNLDTSLVNIKANNNINMPVSDKWNINKETVYEGKDRKKYIFIYKGLSSDKKPVFDFSIE